MSTVTALALRRELHDYLCRAEYGHERLTITRNGKPVAAIIPLEDLELLRAIEDRIDLAEAEAALREAESEGTIPWEQVKAELGGC